MRVLHGVLRIVAWIAAAACGLGVLGIVVLTTGIAEGFGCRVGTFARLSCPGDAAGRTGELIWTSAAFVAIVLPVAAVVALAAWSAARLVGRRSAAGL